jgi:tetratricopeptide (TPR) repeat protein
LVLAAGLWVSPASPLALSRGDVALGQGQPADAVALYDAAAEWTPFPSMRRTALDRAATVLEAELHDPSGARQRLNELLQDELGPEIRASLGARVAATYQLEGKHARAAAEWRDALEIAPEAVDAALWRARSAGALADAGRPRRALAQWVLLVQEHPAWRAQANLNRAQLLLAGGDVSEALPLFEDVVRVGDAAEVAAGRLGASVCLERLGNLDEALARLDLADLPDDVHRTRADGLRQRALWAP